MLLSSNSNNLQFDLCVSVNEDGLVIDKGDEMDVDQRDSNKYYIY